MSKAILRRDQRENLLILIGRRLNGLDDGALLELERLTRNPERLAELVSTAAEAEDIAFPALSQSPPTDFYRHEGGGISRRKLLAGLGTLAAVGIAGGGGYVLGSLEERETAERYAQLNALVQTAIDNLGSRVMELAGEGLGVANAARVLRDVATSCLDRYPEMQWALETWWAQTTLVMQDYQAMQLVEGGVRAVTEVLSMLAALPRLVLRVLGESIELELASTEALSSALLAVSDLLTHLDSALHSASAAHECIVPWFSGVAASDIRDRLLRPLEDDLGPRVIELGTRCWQLELDWRNRLVEPVNAAQQQGV